MTGDGMDPGQDISAVRGWLEDLGHTGVTEDGATLRFELSGADVPAELQIGIDTATVTAEADLGPAGDLEQAGEVVQTVARSRGGLLQAEREGSRVRVVSTIYLDGFSKHTLAAALGEVEKALEQLDRELTAAVELGSLLASADQERELARAELDRVTRTSEPASTPASAAPAAWSPTHLIPAGGSRFWTAPDPAAAAAGALAAGTPVRLEETRGAWGRVSAANGWSGWVDVRVLAVRS